ncbi:MAG: CAP domain-containing protein [Paracoccaceae bacterium]
MLRIVFLAIISSFFLAACGAPPPTKLGADGKPLPRAYKISAGQTGKIQFRMLDSVNALREASGVQTLQMDAKLNAAAATHSRDMANQNRAWHFGSDGSSPIDRSVRAGYSGTLLGENISETYETELETLSAWMEQSDTRAIILQPEARDMGFSWYQQKDGKLWWTLLTGG